MRASLIPTWLQEFEKEAGYMGIQLTDEEIKKLPKFIMGKITTRPEVVAKAQLKKVVEKWYGELIRTVKGVNGEYGYRCEAVNHFMQVLLKEIE